MIAILCVLMRLTGIGIGIGTQFARKPSAGGGGGGAAPAIQYSLWFMNNSA